MAGFAPAVGSGVQLYQTRWTEIDETVRRLKLLEVEFPPTVTYGICPDCDQRLKAEIAAARPE